MTPFVGQLVRLRDVPLNASVVAAPARPCGGRVQQVAPEPTRRAPAAVQDLPFWSHVDRGAEDECWLWTGYVTPRGYGQAKYQRRVWRAHRLAYELLVGPIPECLELDHTCHTQDETCPGGETCPHRRCVNPAHLEPVTNVTNTRRGMSPTAIAARLNECIRGHSLADAYVNPDGTRRCRTCDLDRQRRRSAAKATATTGCRCGHSRTWHRAYRECAADGCTCHAYRHQSQTESTPAADATGSGAHNPQEMTP